MPRGDGTGPLGQGPRTGRGMGYCAGYPVPGFMNHGFGRWFGRGFGWRRWRFIPTPMRPIQGWQPMQAQPQTYQLTKEQELQMLEDEARAIEQEQEILKKELESIRKRMEELKNQK